MDYLPKAPWTRMHQTVSPLIQSPAKDLPQDTQKDASSGKNEEVLSTCTGIGPRTQEEIQMEE